MPIIVVKQSPGDRDIFISEEPIGHLATIYLSGGAKKIKEGTTAQQAAVCGVVLGAVLSGKLVRAITRGFASGLICASSVLPGDRITCANAAGAGLASGPGKIIPLNTITPIGTVAAPSINLAAADPALSGGTGILMISGANSPLSVIAGIASGITGVQAPAFTGTAFNTARILGKALMSGGIGSGIQVLVTLGG